MNDFTLDELTALVDVFNRANLSEVEAVALDLQKRVSQALEQRQELESLDFDDCLGGACKL